jgi:hypothetical protein
MINHCDCQEKDEALSQLHADIIRVQAENAALRAALAFSLSDGDVLVLRLPADSDLVGADAGERIREVLTKHARKDVTVLVIDGATTIERFDEAEMQGSGWVRTSRP